MPPRSSVRSQPLIAVRDVAKAKAWYCELLGLSALSSEMPSDHDHVYDRLLCRGELVLQLHVWDEEGHPNLVGENDAKRGHGVLVWFEVDDFDSAVERARKLGAEVVEEPHVNPGPRHREIWLRDLDGYLVVVVSPDGEAARA